MGATMRVLFLACMAAAAIAVAAQDTSEIIPEALVEELAEAPQQADAVQITRECFERTCNVAGGECRIARMACDRGKMAPWAVFVSPDTMQNKLVQMPAKKKQAAGLVDIVEHKKPLDPNLAIAMPGVPAEASPHMVKAMEKQNQLLKKIVKLEKVEYKKDPLHQETRKKWLDLAATIKHLPPGPDRMKEQVLLLKLAKELADKEQGEKKGQTKKLAAPKANKATGAPVTEADREQAKKLMKGILGKAGMGAQPDAQPDAKSKTIDGIPVGHRECFERACISRTPTGACGAAVISCGSDGKAPAHTGKLSPKAAVKLAKKSMGSLAPLVHAAGKN